MEKVIIPLVIILVIVGVIAGVVFYVKNKVRKFSQDLFGTDSLGRLEETGRGTVCHTMFRIRNDKIIRTTDTEGFPGI